MEQTARDAVPVWVRQQLTRLDTNCGPVWIGTRAAMQWAVINGYADGRKRWLDGAGQESTVGGNN